MNKIRLLLCILLVSYVTNGIAQSTPFPIDPKVKYGKLENGMTYYIRNNKYPEKRADFYIVQNVGSMQEEDDQAGLAHFLEHMAFNGTKNYPGRKTMLNYLETVGAQFGSNVNAYTGFDETVYTLSNIPVTRDAIIDSTLLILHDWSAFLELNDAEIDKERPIIKEEWRTRSGAQTRIWDKQLPVIFEGSKYADRMPIGKMSIIDNFDYQTLKDYYKKWYRPDQQALIIVGDINPDSIESKIIEMFADIPAPKNPAERIYFPVPDNIEPIISIVTDKEETNSRITYFIKHDILPAAVRQTEEGYRQEIALSLAASMLSERLAEISKSSDSPFTASYTYDSDFFVSRSKDAWTSVVISKEGQEKESLAALIRETERVKRFGFTDSELERMKLNLLNGLEQSYNNRDKHQNETYTEEYVRSFTTGEPIPGIEYEYEFSKRMLPTLTAEEINGLITNLLVDENNVITITAPEKEALSIPSQAEVLSIIESVKGEDIEGYMEELITEPLLSQEPVEGDIVDENYNETLDYTLWTLSNGVKVAVKTTPYKDDEIIMRSISYGGLSLAPDSKIYEASIASSVPYIGGIGNFSSTDLNKVLAGKTSSVTPYVNTATHGLNAYSSKKDLETTMQLLYLYFTAPRKDEGMFENVKNMFVTQIQNAKSKPNYVFNQQATFAMYGYDPRHRPMTVEDAESLDYDAIIDFYKEITANPSSYIFTFVGNIDLEVLKPYVKKYIASLPAGNNDVMYNKNAVSEVRKGETKTVFEQKMIEPKTTVFNLYSAKLPYDFKTRQELNLLNQILDLVYTEKIREQEGGTYGVMVDMEISRIPEGEALLTLRFDTDPDKVGRLAPLVHNGLMDIVENGPRDQDLQKVKEYAIKKLEEDQLQNGYWASIVQLETLYGEDASTDAIDRIRNITKEDIQAIAKDLLSQGNYIEIIMNPLKNK